jgi:hypothetical protein
MFQAANKKAGFVLLYTNPLNKQFAFQAGYIFNAYKDINEKNTYRVSDPGRYFIPSLSNYFKSSYITQEVLITLKKSSKKVYLYSRNRGIPI